MIHTMNANTENMHGLMIQAFDFNEQAVRTVLRDGEPWVVAADVCRVLEIANSRDALKALESDEKASVGIADTSSSSRNSITVNVVNESGLYALIFKSRKAEARKFRRWVTGVVLPLLRKQGAVALATAAVRDAETLRLEAVREEVTARVRVIEGMGAFAADSGVLGRKLSLEQVSAIHALGTMRLEALQFLWRLETVGHKTGLLREPVEG